MQMSGQTLRRQPTQEA